MILSMWFYSTRYGWPFSALFVIGIFVHEIGHVVVAAALRVPVSAPVFIPYFGALILQKKLAKNAWGEALIGIGGPIGGTIAGLIYLGIYAFTGNGLFAAVAYFTFFINLFNMVPMFPLDGGRIVGAVSPYLWLVGMVLLLVGFVTRIITSPLILVIVILTIPQVWTALKRGTADRGFVVTTQTQRVIMGIAYIGLSMFLFVVMAISAYLARESGGMPIRRSRPKPQSVASLQTSPAPYSVVRRSVELEADQPAHARP